MDGFVDDACVQMTCDYLGDEDRVHEMTEKNYEIAKEHFSFEVLEKRLVELLANFK